MKNQKTNILKAVSAFAIAVAMNACSSSTNEENPANNSADTSNPINAEKNAKAKKVFSTIPPPVETTQMLKEAGAKYNSNYLNPIENASKYSTTKAKALNLGVYGSDLSFISLYDQTQESMLFLKCTNTLASGLGISGAFDENTTSRIQNNMDQKDSLLAIINQSYWTADNYLVDNGQPGVSSLIVAGGWVEGLYIATRVANDTKSDKIKEEILKQKSSLESLIELLESFKTDNAGNAEVLKLLLDLKKVFDADSAAGATAKTDADKGETTVSPKISDEQFKALSNKAAEVRNAIIAP